ncbi:MAG: phosphatase [Acidimicrobiales bacterium]
MTDRAALGRHLATSGLAGTVATPVSSCIDNARRLVAGRPDHTFGLSDWRDVDVDAVIAALRACGVTLGEAEDLDATAYVDPAVAAAAVEHHGAVLAEWARGGARVLLATGHAFALLPHYAGLARALEAAGCRILEPLGGERERLKTPEGEPCSVRYFEGVGSLIVHGSLRHTHRPDYMEAMLDAAGGPAGVDAVIADHGFAGAAIEAGVPTVSIADVNDPALPLAQACGRTDGVLVIDDGLPPATYEPLTAVMIAGFLPRTEGRLSR